MKKIHKILIPIFSVLLVLSIVALVFIKTGLINNFIPFSKNGEFNGTDFTQLNSVTKTTNRPVMKSDIENIYYTVEADGAVKYFEYSSGSLNDYKGEVKTIELSPECSYVRIPLTIYYVEVGGKTVGYGLFSSDNSDGKVKYYSYVFAKLIDAPTVYGLKGKMLLLNTNPDEAFTLNKTYTEMFDVDMDKQTCSTFTSQRDRNAEKSGRLAERWNIITDSQIKSASKKATIVSGRLYDEKTEIFDIFDLNDSENKPDVSGMYTTFLREDKDSGYVYLKKTANGFKSVKFITDEKVITEFIGNIKTDFVFSGNWVYSNNESKFTNLLTGEEIVVEKLGKINFFTVNADETKIAAVANYTNQGFYIIEKDGSSKGYSGTDIFNTSINNICFVDNETVLTTTVNEKGACINYLTKTAE